MKNNLTIFIFITIISFQNVAIANQDHKESERIINVCSVNLHCPEGFETKQLEKFRTLVKRDAQGLSLGLDDGKLKALTLKDHLNNDAGYKKYTFITYFSSVGYYLLHLQQYEGGTIYLYINAKNGTMETTNGYRHFSPEGEHYVTSHIDIDYEFPDNWIAIFQLGIKGSKKEWAIIYQPEQVDGKPKYTGPSNLKWASKNEIVFEEVSLIGGRPPYIKKKAYLAHENGKWVYHGNIEHKHLEIK